jgi:hypothetical protein
LASGLALRCPASFFIPGHTGPHLSPPHDHPPRDDVDDSGPQGCYAEPSKCEAE